MEQDTLYDYVPDNDALDYTSHYSAQRPYRPQRYNSDREEEVEDPVDGNVWGRLGRLLDFVTGPRFAVVVAIVVVLMFQFQGTLLQRWRSYFPRELTVREFLCELWWSVHDYTRAYMQMGMEQVRRLVSRDSENAVALSPARNRVRRRRIRRETSSSMPELEDVPDSEQTGGPPGGFPENLSSFAMNGTSDTIRNRHAEPEMLRRNNVPIPQHRVNDMEPAFLNDRDYPPGWMVYHRVLGVVPKTEADRYDREPEAAAESNGTTGMNGNHDDANGHSTGGSDARQEEEQQQQILRSIAATG